MDALVTDSLDLYAWLKQDRCWPRHYRIQHAIMRRNKAESHAEKTFWTRVIEANEAYPGEHKRPIIWAFMDDEQKALLRRDRAEDRARANRGPFKRVKK